MTRGHPGQIAHNFNEDKEIARVPALGTLGF
jgi:hypothetical protein